ncbi:MAG: tubulin-like doman-containing protein [Oscillospiraceae bacterium]|jgi:hypothetical protein|nr:tubulin-like doman-containing protein [Oscillospiraceae bacterium]
MPNTQSYNVVIFIGGTGARVMEACTHAAAMGMIGPVELVSLIIDKDSNCGNTLSAKKARSRYADLKSVINPAKACEFATAQIKENDWSFDGALSQLLDVDAETTLKNTMVSDKTSQTDKVLLNALYSRDEQNQSTQKGFYGHPSIGALLFKAMLKSGGFKNDNSLNLAYGITEALKANRETRVFIAGSVFGGTGASVYSNIARYFRETAKKISPQANEHLHISGALMLPYFGIPKNIEGKAEPDQNDIRVLESEFFIKSKVALEQYGKDAKMVRRKDNKDFIFDTLYVLGGNHLDSTAKYYVDGDREQENHFHAAEFFAAGALGHFFSQDAAELPGSVNDSNIYTYCLSTGDAPVPKIEWENMPTDYRRKVSAMLRFCVFVITTVKAGFALAGPGESQQIPIVKRIHGGFGKMGADDFELLKQASEQVYSYCAGFVRYLRDVLCTGHDWSSDDENDPGRVGFAELSYLQSLVKVCKKLDTDRKEGLLDEIAYLSDHSKVFSGEDADVNSTKVGNRLQTQSFGSGDISARAAEYFSKAYAFCKN